MHLGQPIGESWLYCDVVADAVLGADAAVILTEWQNYAELPWEALAPLMRQPAWVFDTRAITDVFDVCMAGLNQWRVGCGVV